MPPTNVHPDFLALYRSVCLMGASIIRAGAALTPQQKRALIADLKGGDEQRAIAALSSLGTSESVINEQRQLISSLASRHPLPRHVALIKPIVEQGVAAAKLSYPDDAGGGPAEDPLDDLLDEVSGSGGSDDSGGNTACLTACQAQAAALATAALTAYIAALVACQALGPFSIVCALVATANYSLALYELDAVVDRCVANCG
jgi:hypothetical protein